MIINNHQHIPWSNFRVDNSKVHIWHASLEQPTEVVQTLEAMLSEEEKETAKQFRYQQRRQTFIVSRGILRVLLSRYTDIVPEQIQFKYALSGKPFLADAAGSSNLQFNLSHAGLLTLYAFSWGRQVGIDVECIRSSPELNLIARRNFSPAEYRRFQNISKQDQLQAFYHCWTRREAFIKAASAGHNFSAAECEVSFEPNAPAKLLTVAGSPEQAKNWSMHDLKTWDGYAAALVVEGNDYAISNQQWTYPHYLNKNPKPLE